MRSLLTAFPALPIVAILAVVFSLVSPFFLTPANIEATLAANAVVLIASVGMTFVFLVGGIDLSVATVISASAVISGIVMAGTGSIALGVLAALSTGLAFGVLNGLLVGVLGLAPFITTMGTLLIARGVAFILSQGIAIKGTPFGLLDFGFLTFLGIPAVTLVGLAVALMSGIALTQTTWGRELMLVGSNRNSARYVGINVRFVEFSVYSVAGLLAGIAGFISIANLGNAIPGVGDTLLLVIIGAVVLGGTTLTGGEGSISRTITGVLLLAVLTSGLNLVGIPFYDQLIIQGVLILFGTWLASRLGRRSDR